MITVPALTYSCGCSGPAEKDDNGNTCIYPEMRCETHMSPHVTARVYTCGCWATVDPGTQSFVHMRCAAHRDARFTHGTPFTHAAYPILRPCGCMGQSIGLSHEAGRPVCYVPAERVCAEHKVVAVDCAIVFHECGCALIGVRQYARCDLHASVIAALTSDPFLTLDEKPEMEYKK